MIRSKSNISFVIGIHGSGEGNDLNPICKTLRLKYLSESEIIKWAEINPDNKNKNISDIPTIQNRLIKGPNAMITDGGNFVLDGHTCLFNTNVAVSKIPLVTFRLINPKNIIIFSAVVNEVKNRLQIPITLKAGNEVLDEYICKKLITQKHKLNL
jgi:adenylate kinase